jgi:hypothetical protein
MKAPIASKGTNTGGALVKASGTSQQIFGKGKSG